MELIRSVYFGAKKGPFTGVSIVHLKNNIDYTHMGLFSQISSQKLLSVMFGLSWVIRSFPRRLCNKPVLLWEPRLALQGQSTSEAEPPMSNYWGEGGSWG